MSLTLCMELNGQFFRLAASHNTRGCNMIQLSGSYPSFSCKPCSVASRLGGRMRRWDMMRWDGERTMRHLRRFPKSLRYPHLSGWWLGHPSEKYEFVNWDDNRNPILIWENIKFMATSHHQPVIIQIGPWLWVIHGFFLEMPWDAGRSSILKVEPLNPNLKTHGLC